MKLLSVMRNLMEGLEILFVAFAVIVLLVYPSLSTKVEISYGADIEKIQVAGSELALDATDDLPKINEGGLWNVYELPVVDEANLSEMEKTMTEVFTEEVAEIASTADMTKVTMAVDENGFLVAYDPNGYLDIQGDLPVFRVSLGDETGYIFGFSPAVAQTAE
ncbi:MAG: hypothetical protein Q4E46_02640 [Candidatus Saccharibacteria bacterium]|nr:hypothetical protein [Candidatus Saccharibacteria bacterium]